MHTNEPTRHTTTINGHLHYNRRVPRHAVDAFGPQIRIRIKDFVEADRLTKRLNDIWAEDHIEVSPDLQTLLAATDLPRVFHPATTGARWSLTPVGATTRVSQRVTQELRR
jgi:hypothetical protein